MAAWPRGRGRAGAGLTDAPAAGPGLVRSEGGRGGADGDRACAQRTGAAREAGVRLSVRPPKDF